MAKNTICLLDDVRDVFIEMLRNYCLNSRQNSLKEVSMLLMASVASRDLVLSCIETLDFSYLHWFSVSKSPIGAGQYNLRWAFYQDNIDRGTWSRQRCFSFVIKTTKMSKLRYLDISGLRIDSDKEIQRLLDSLGATRLHTLKAQFWMDDTKLPTILNHPSGNLAGSLKHLDISHCARLNSSCLILLSEKCPQLQDLIWYAPFRPVTGLQNVHTHLESFVKSCRNLRKLVAPAWLHSNNSLSWMNSIPHKLDLLGVSVFSPTTDKLAAPNPLLTAAAPYVTQLKNIIMPTNAYIPHATAYRTPLMGTYGQYLISFGEPSVDRALENCLQKSQNLNLLPSSLLDFESGIVPPMMLPFWSYYGNTAVFDHFLDAGFDPFSSAYNGFHAFAAVALKETGQRPLLERILNQGDSNGGEIDGKRLYSNKVAHFNVLGFNLLHACALWGRTRSEFGWLLNQESLEKFQLNINTQDMFGYTPLHYAVLNDSRNLIKRLLNNGARVDARAHFGNRDTPCKLAVRNGCGSELLVRLLARPLLDEWAEREPQWALCAALLMGRKRLLRKLILDRYKDEDTRRKLLVDAESIFPLAVAILRSSDTLFQYVLTEMPYFFDCISILEHYDPRGRIGIKQGTVLHLAVVQNRPKTLKLLLDKGAHTSECDEYGRTPLQIAMQYNFCLDLVPLLIQIMHETSPHSLNQRDQIGGHTALHWVGRLPQTHAASITRTLLRCEGIDKEPLDNRKRTPVALAKSQDVLDVFAEFAIRMK